MELPNSYADLIKFVPEKARPMFDASMKMQADRTNALNQQIAERQIALEEQRAIKQAELQKQFSELNPEMQKFPAVLHDLKRQQILNDMDFEKEATMLSVYGQDPVVAEKQLKMVDDKYKRFEQELKPVEETKLYDTARQNWLKISDSNKRIGTVIEGLNATKKLIESGDKQGALDNLRTSVIKPMSNMESNDAVGVGDTLFKYTGLLSAPETAQFQSKSAFNPTAYTVKLLAAKNNEEKEGVKKDLLDKIESLFTADPTEFLKTAIVGANFHVDAYNKDLKNQVINTTSPGVARRMGAVPMEYIAPLEPGSVQPQNRLATPNPFGQTVSGGAGATGPANMQPQQTNTLNAPIKGSTIFRIKK